MFWQLLRRFHDLASLAPSYSSKNLEDNSRHLPDLRSWVSF